MGRCPWCSERLIGGTHLSSIAIGGLSGLVALLAMELLLALR